MAQVQQGESSTLSPEGQGGRGHAIESGSQIALGECVRACGGLGERPVSPTRTRTRVLVQQGGFASASDCPCLL